MSEVRGEWLCWVDWSYKPQHAHFTVPNPSATSAYMDTSDFVTALHGIPNPTFLPEDVHSPASTLHFRSIRERLLINGGLRERHALFFTDKTSDSLGLRPFAVHLLPSDTFLPLCCVHPTSLSHIWSLSLQSDTCWCCPPEIALSVFLALSCCSDDSLGGLGILCFSTRFFGIFQCVISAFGSALTSFYHRHLSLLLCWWL